MSDTIEKQACDSCGRQWSGFQIITSCPCGAGKPTAWARIVPAPVATEVMEVTEEAVRGFVDNLEENQRAYIAWDEMYVEDADDYTPCVKIDGTWTVGALQDAITAALKGKKA